MQAVARRAAPAIFALTLFSSAALIFVLQPLFAHLVTPLLGGSPAVWNVSMAFFQAALLTGYLYAHLLARLKDLRAQAAIHALVLVAAFLVLPVRVSDLFGPPSSVHPALWLVGVLAASVGAPFAAVSATAPLLQSWYARSGRADAHDPYYLYAASNLGSFVGLLAYPALIEPLLGVRAQGLDWAAGYMLVGAFILVAGATVLSANGAVASTHEDHSSPALSWRQRLYWMAAAAAPSALILGVTLHISTDVTSAPLLWVIPLALYLATFVIAFARGAQRLAPGVELVFPFALFFLVASYFSRGAWAAALGANLFGFFISALLCHLALARTRPPADRLTEFYLFVSLGGVLGGAFAAFVAPVIFNDVYEYPLALAAAALFLPRHEDARPLLSNTAAAAGVFMALIAVLLMLTASRDAIIVAGLVGSAAAVVAAGWDEDGLPPFRYGLLVIAGVLAMVLAYAAFNISTLMPTYVDHGDTKFKFKPGWDWAIGASAFFALLFSAHASLRRRAGLVVDLALGGAIPAALMLVAFALMRERLNGEALLVLGLGISVIALFFNRTRPLVLAGLVLTSFVMIFLHDVQGGRVITQERSFFGVLRTRVLDDPADPRVPQLRVLMHGTTIHGAQLHAPGLTTYPLTYYNPNTALGEAILAGLNAGDNSRLALIGLGTGTTACLMRPSEHLTIFEIDPAVVRLSARPGGDFTYVPECQPRAQVRLGDARLQIAHEPDGAFDVIVVDAFSSDAIPAHLLTREAIALYLRKASNRGVVVLHLSNRNLALVGESARVAHDLGAPALFRVSEQVRDPHAPYYGGLPASVMIVAKSPAVLARLPLLSTNWRVISPPPGRAWSDDYINVSRALWENLSGAEECRVYPNNQRCVVDSPAPQR